MGRKFQCGCQVFVILQIASKVKTYKERPFVHLFFCKKNTNLGYWMNTNSEILMEQSFYNVNFCRNHIPTWHFEIRWQPGKKNEFAYDSTPMTFSISTRSYYIPYVSQDFFQVLSKRFLPCMYLISATGIAGTATITVVSDRKRNLFPQP